MEVTQKTSDNRRKKRPPDLTDAGGSTRHKCKEKTAKAPESIQSAKPRRKWRICCVVLLSIVVAVIAVLLAIIFKSRSDIVSQEREYLKLRMGEEGIELFQNYDRDGDGYISLGEFEPLVDKLLVEDIMSTPMDFSMGDSDMDPSQEIITIDAHFKPLLKDSLRKAGEFLSEKYTSALIGLDDWTKPNQEVAAFPVGLFQAFLPTDIIPVGKPYPLIKSNLNFFSNTLSNNRFYPPKVKGNEVAIHRLLSMFHRRPFVHTRFGPQGAKAVIRAENEKYVDVVFRIHAEFQLNEPPNNPFWFTPAQFTGNLLLTKDSSHIQDFHMYVPNNGSLNVDMEWLYGSSENNNMEVEIGYLPQMELTVTEPSMQVAIYDENGEILFEPDRWQHQKKQKEKITWDIEIPLEEALRVLTLDFYPFKKIPYLPFKEAFQRAEAEKKLVHSILLWGALDDQSC